MKLGFISILLLGLVLIFGGAFAWLALTDVPVQQQEIVVNVPVGGAQ